MFVEKEKTLGGQVREVTECTVTAEILKYTSPDVMKDTTRIMWLAAAEQFHDNLTAGRSRSIAECRSRN